MLNPATRLGRLAGEIHSPFDAFERAGDAVGRGNRKVFFEIGREFARYMETRDPALPPDHDEVRRFLDGLRRAFARYQEQRFERDESVRAQLIFLANLEIGLHEQTRLQPETAEASNAPAETALGLGRRAAGVLLPGAAGWLRVPLAGLLAPAARAFDGFKRRLIREIVTGQLMVLLLPGPLVLSLGRRLDGQPCEALARITHPELLRLLAGIEPDNLPAGGAADWSDLRQRMRYIARLFLPFHGRPELFEPPFTAGQIARLQAGCLPEGDL